jgi:hypothetical protein
MFSEPKAALEANTKFDNDYLDGCKICCFPPGILKTNLFKEGSGHLKFFYSLCISKGEAYIGFSDFQSANNAIEKLTNLFPHASVENYRDDRMILKS